MDDQTAKSPQLLAIGFIQDAKAYVESARVLDRVQGSIPNILLTKVFPALSGDGTAVEGPFVSFWRIQKSTPHSGPTQHRIGVPLCPTIFLVRSR